MKALSRELPLSADVDFKVIALNTSNYTGADLKALLYNAQLLQVRRTLESNDTINQTTTKTETGLRTGTGMRTGTGLRNELDHGHNISVVKRNNKSNTPRGPLQQSGYTNNHSRSVWQFSFNKQTEQLEKKMSTDNQVRERRVGERVGEREREREGGRGREREGEREKLTML